jgi:AcrR family transcriptional regulator
MPAPETSTRRSRGRPRQFEEQAEIKLILDAAAAVIRGGSYSTATVQDILDQAGLSTRAFYRHFQSKDDLVRALYHRDAEIVGQRLARRVESAGSPRAAVEEWLDEVLALAFDSRRADRRRMFESEVSHRLAGYSHEAQFASEIMEQPLIAALNAGRRDGSFPKTNPREDAFTIRSMAISVFPRALVPDSRLTRPGVLAHLLRFILPALGWDGP